MKVFLFMETGAIIKVGKKKYNAKLKIGLESISIERGLVLREVALEVPYSGVSDVKLEEGRLLAGVRLERPGDDDVELSNFKLEIGRKIAAWVRFLSTHPDPSEAFAVPYAGGLTRRPIEKPIAGVLFVYPAALRYLAFVKDGAATWTVEIPRTSVKPYEIGVKEVESASVMTGGINFFGDVVLKETKSKRNEIVVPFLEDGRNEAPRFILPSGDESGRILEIILEWGRPTSGSD